ncbi:nitrilase [Lasiosphaeria hispida]|uniref:Nitrilase n=1 Tax=Lasiosphaeria hispida TaxID=260671 RepID=A0AAJ0HFK7_9PEZI|nr:nitrilase [Lasiosphaeria hispida]
MAGRKRNAPTRSSPRATRSSARLQNADAPPAFLRQMVAAAITNVYTQEPASPERPSKRLRRPGEGDRTPSKPHPFNVIKANDDGDKDEDEGDVEFEDVPLPAAAVQTIIADTDDEDEDDIEFEDVDIDPAASSSAVPAGEPTRELSLNLTVQKKDLASRRVAERRKAINSEEKGRRVQVHKLHLLCLLAHVERRNAWCDDSDVQKVLRPLLTEKVVQLLNPSEDFTQFRRMQVFKSGLQEASNTFKARFKITERGLRRALWPEDEEQLKNYQLPEDAETTLDKGDFLEAARSLKGSRDVGAQLFCALLRRAGVETRLVCSLQPLACAPGAPTLPKQRPLNPMPPKLSKGEIYAAAMAKYETKATDTAGATPSPRRRLGHPNAAAYHVPSMTAPDLSPSRPVPQGPKPIQGESPYPIYWVEVLDHAHQKWHPVDPLVTGTLWKPQSLEPPASDMLNCLSYAIAFEADGSALDVTRRYAKAYNSKTTRLRIDGPYLPANRIPTSSNTAGTPGLNPGQRWWRRTMRTYARNPPKYLDQIEQTELANTEAREPMPRNISDFKDHPVYALVRHLRRHEVIVPEAEPAGTVGAGSKAALERVYRRRDLRVAHSRDKWYRLGRVVRPDEEAVRILPKRVVRRRPRFGGGVGIDYEEEDEEEGQDDPDKVGLFGEGGAGTPIYMSEQTDLYEAPPVVDGRVPKNRFKNIDVYVPSMVPKGGVHIVHERAAQAAWILGVDYAPALTGFEFKGRQGTAVLKGVVVPEESEEGIWAVIEGLVDLEAEMERERRSRRALRMWSRFIKVLRIRERIWAGVNDEEEGGGEDGDRENEEGVEGKGKGIAVDEEEDDNIAGAASDVSEEYYMGEDGEGGGFMVE